MSSKVRTRFAPSPTGFLHVGGVRTALFNYLYAKQNSGQFILRLEDTDRERFVAEGVGQIVEALEWLGLKPDEGFWISEGKHQNIEFVQSERHKTGHYLKAARELIKNGVAYYSPTTSAELSKMREIAQKEKSPFRYRKSFDKNNSETELNNCPIRIDIEAIKNKYQEFLKVGAPYPGISWRDETRNQSVIEDVSGVEDFILIKSDGFPSYNFANVVDDSDMNITHVLRGDEFIASTAKHVLLYRIFGLEPPAFVHLPVINGIDGKKLSKRTGDTNVLDFRNKGYLPEALLNFLALLGWNDGTEQEIFTLEELKAKFKLKQINTSPAVFDQKRLDWISGHHIRSLSLEELYKRVGEFWSPQAKKADDTYKKRVLGLVQERLKYFAELPELTQFFFVDLPLNPELISSHKQLKKYDKARLEELLEQTKTELVKLNNFEALSIQKTLNELLEKTGEKPVVLFSLIRIATTQASASPGLAETMEVLSKETCIKRIDQQIAAL